MGGNSRPEAVVVIKWLIVAVTFVVVVSYVSKCERERQALNHLTQREEMALKQQHSDVIEEAVRERLFNILRKNAQTNAAAAACGAHND